MRRAMKSDIMSIRRGALYNQQTSNQSIGHKCSQFPQTIVVHHLFARRNQKSVATSFAKLVLTKTILFCTVVVRCG